MTRACSAWVSVLALAGAAGGRGQVHDAAGVPGHHVEDRGEPVSGAERPDQEHGRDPLDGVGERAGLGEVAGYGLDARGQHGGGRVTNQRQHLGNAGGRGVGMGGGGVVGSLGDRPGTTERRGRQLGHDRAPDGPGGPHDQDLVCHACHRRVPAQDAQCHEVRI
jgi:hypothetical protein